MLSYRHSFHAGNHADVIKHIVQTLIINALKEKDKAFTYIDTHAGAGCYTLTHSHATKTAEYLAGIALLWEQPSHPIELDTYFNLIHSFNSGGELKHYPGSPAISQYLLRSQDQLLLAELHPSDYPKLNQLFAHDLRATVMQTDGYQLLKSHLPPTSRRGFILLDPSYELKTDYGMVINAIKEGYKRFANGIFAIWYPVVLRQNIKRMLTGLCKSNIHNILQIELTLQPDNQHYGLTASGMIVINPPWRLEQQIKNIAPWLLSVLTNKRGRFTVSWLVPE